MHADVLIVGLGLSGSFFSREAKKAGLDIIAIDDGRPHAASRVAAGLINPVTGKRSVTTWMAADLLPVAKEAYNLPNGGSFLTETRILSFFPTPDARNLFLERLEQDDTYLALEEEQWERYFHNDFGYGTIRPAYQVDLKGLLSTVRGGLAAEGKLLEETFREDDLSVEKEGIRYGDITARYIIFCDGAESAGSPWFGILPFSLSKGEALLAEIPDLPAGPVYKKGLSLVHLGERLYWAGSSYAWSFTDPFPTEAFRKNAEQSLGAWLKVPFRVVDHVAGVRPTTVEQKPFVGLHPVYTQIGILGGMGTKGCSLTPYFARQLVELLVKGVPIMPEADVRRFTRLLSRPGGPL